MAKSDLLVWMDLEMSGLNPEQDRILEIAAMITDGELRIVAEGPSLVIHQPESLLAGMDEWNQKHHGRSGLTERVRQSTLQEHEAESLLLDFICEHCVRGTAPLAGNSVHQDRRFLRRYMPRLEDFLHYRIVDVSTVKELVRRWFPEVYRGAPPKAGAHRALDDIRESVLELRYYRDHAFRRASPLALQELGSAH